MIVLENIDYTYPNGNSALKKISLQIGDCENVAIIGSAGAGKSTLMKIIDGALSPQSGTVKIDGVRLTRKTKPALCRKLGIAGQMSTGKLLPLVSDTVAASARSRGFSEEETALLAEHALKMLKIEKLREKSTRALSCTERHAVELAAAIAMQPSVLLLDDPTALLDLQLRRAFVSAMQFLPHTKIMATCDLELVLALCSRAILLKDGEILAQGDPHTLLRNVSLMKDAGLYVPFSIQRCDKCGKSGDKNKKIVAFPPAAMV